MVEIFAIGVDGLLHVLPCSVVCCGSLVVIVLQPNRNIT